MCISRLKAVLGEGGWSTDPVRLRPSCWNGAIAGPALRPLLAAARSRRPRFLQWWASARRPGSPSRPRAAIPALVGGQIPQGEILLSTERLRAIRDLDAFDDVIVAEAGLPLAAVHEAALSARAPLSPGPSLRRVRPQSAGVVSTNAGGTAGPCALGPLAIWCWAWRPFCPMARSGMASSACVRTTPGYDLKQLLIGAEGTLGVVTARQPEAVSHACQPGHRHGGAGQSASRPSTLLGPGQGGGRVRG